MSFHLDLLAIFGEVRLNKTLCATFHVHRYFHVVPNLLGKRNLAAPEETRAHARLPMEMVLLNQWRMHLQMHLHLHLQHQPFAVVDRCRVW
jgi:hypothetical protein